MPMLTISATMLSLPVRRVGMLLIRFIALGAAALSLGGCTCADANGDSIACPEQY
jgi:hypothetical protein